MQVLNLYASGISDDSLQTAGRLSPLRITPLSHQNQFPLISPVGIVNQPSLEYTGSGLLEFSIQQHYSALHFFKNSENLSVGLDMEYLQYQFKAGHQFNSKWSVQYMQAVTWHWKGFMDPFLIWYHEKLNLPNYGREERDADEYYYSVSGLNESDQFSAPPRKWLLNDPVFGLYYSLISTNEIRLTFGMNIQIPVTGTDTGTGNGELNTALSAYLAYRYQKLDIFQNVSVILPGKSPDFFWGKMNNYLMSATGSSYRVSGTSYLITQFQYGTSPYVKLENTLLDNHPIEILVGYRFESRFGRCTVSFAEDLRVPAPDFTISLTYELPLR